MQAHVAQCAEYARLYREDQQAALDPGPEFDRWSKFEAGQEKMAARQQRVGRLIEGNERKLQAAADRWATPKDILE